jgi:hypothetical protein
MLLQLDLRCLLKKLGAEHALYCAQIAAGLAREIALESFVAESRRIVVEAEEQGRWHRGRATLDAQQMRPLRVADANGGVRSAKIYAARKCHAPCSGHRIACLAVEMRRSATLAGFRPLTSLQFFLTPWCIQKIEIAKRGARAASYWHDRKVGEVPNPHIVSV